MRAKEGSLISKTRKDPGVFLSSLKSIEIMERAAATVLKMRISLQNNTYFFPL